MSDLPPQCRPESRVRTHWGFCCTYTSCPCTMPVRNRPTYGHSSIPALSLSWSVVPGWIDLSLRGIIPTGILMNC